MERHIDMKEISDGRFYGLNDMVKAGCNDCKGCSACCRGMGSSVVLDPLDVFRLEQGLGCVLQELLDCHLDLRVADGIVLPCLKMTGPEEACTFLDENGRCRIHAFRPGFCRIFPLGRIYEKRSFRYFLQVNECKAENRTKIKVRRWIDTPDVKRNEQFLNSWHYFLKDLQESLKMQSRQERAKELSLYILKEFFQKPYDLKGDFYDQFDRRLAEAKKYWKLEDWNK